VTLDAILRVGGQTLGTVWHCPAQTLPRVMPVEGEEAGKEENMVAG
jgi:hypothetical protein